MGCIWLTGIPGAGKTTLARTIQHRTDAVVLDGDELRQGISSDLGWSPAARREHVRRAAWIAHYFQDEGYDVVCAFVMPPDAKIKRICQPMHHVYLECSLEVARKRRHYEPRKGQGLAIPYKHPVQADVVVNTEHLGIEESADLILGVGAAV